MMRRPLRTISAILLAVLTSLVSAAALCLVPCELLPAAHHAEAAAVGSDHCAGVGTQDPHGLVVSASADSCAAQHAWDGPAADRTAPRITADVFDLPVSPGPETVIRPLQARPRVFRSSPHPSPPPLSAPLRI